ncbi:PadR family transcriptional regulator [Saccharopolyspora taberi]|uniref:Helix-turn-helix transcriptional regulator n=1 Tax=Saccharopolyspora taberi TaxID=60895 RepID=A0ABN3V5B5_9PSEU
MSLRYALLGHLAYEAASGYELTKRFEQEFGHYAWYARHTQIYPELNRLAAEGLIEVVAEGARGSRTYAITAEGRDQLRHWLTNPPQEQHARNEGVLRLFLLSSLEKEDALELLRAKAEECEREAKQLRAISEEIDRHAEPGGKLPFGRIASEFGWRSYEATREWALWAIKRIEET